MSASERTRRALNKGERKDIERAEIRTENIWFLPNYKQKRFELECGNEPSLSRSNARPGRPFPSEGITSFLSLKVRLTVTIMTMVSDRMSEIIPPIRTEETKINGKFHR
jgi:hypothetical protein